MTRTSGESTPEMKWPWTSVRWLHIQPISQMIYLISDQSPRSAKPWKRKSSAQVGTKPTIPKHTPFRYSLAWPTPYPLPRFLGKGSATPDYVLLISLAFEHCVLRATFDPHWLQYKTCANACAMAYAIFKRKWNQQYRGDYFFTQSHEVT